MRQPLDFLAHPEIIPGATRIAPKDIAEQTASFSRDQNSVIYCTGGDDETFQMVLGKARALNFTRVKLLKRRTGSVEGEGISDRAIHKFISPRYGELTSHSPESNNSGFDTSAKN